MITSRGKCVYYHGNVIKDYHGTVINGGTSHLTTCYRRTSASSCESYCTSRASCVGYYYGGRYGYCYLIPNVKRCPSGFRLNTLFTQTAGSSAKLVAKWDWGFFCYGRRTGRIDKYHFDIRPKCIHTAIYQRLKNVTF